MSALVVYCYITNHEQLKSFHHNTHLLSHAVSAGQESETDLAGLSNSGCQVSS